MEKSLTVRVDPKFLDAARVCAAREHRSFTNFVEVSLRGRIDAVSIGNSTSRPVVSPAQDRSTRGQ